MADVSVGQSNGLQNQLSGRWCSSLTWKRGDGARTSASRVWQRSSHQMESRIWADAADIPAFKCIARGCGWMCRQTSRTPSRCQSRCGCFSFLFAPFFRFILKALMKPDPSRLHGTLVRRSGSFTPWICNYFFSQDRHFNQSVGSEWDWSHWCRTHCVHPAGKCTGRTSLIEIEISAGSPLERVACCNPHCDPQET